VYICMQGRTSRTTAVGPTELLIRDHSKGWEDRRGEEGEHIPNVSLYIYIHIYVKGAPLSQLRLPPIVLLGPTPFRGLGKPSRRGGSSFQYITLNIYTYMYIHTYEQALVCLSNREIVDASRERRFHCKIANNRFLY